MLPEEEERMLGLMERYKRNMLEIKNRMRVIQDLENSHSEKKLFTGFIETDIDLLYLQLRKINEIIIFSCIIANEAAVDLLNKTLRRGWQLEKIKKSLEVLNENYFPYPVKIVPKENGEYALEKHERNDRVYLTESELFDIYKDASDYVHAKRDYQYGSGGDCIDILNKGFGHASKIIRLLSHHWTPISNSKQFAVIMEHGENKDIKVILMERKACDS